MELQEGPGLLVVLLLQAELKMVKLLLVDRKGSKAVISATVGLRINNIYT